MSVDTAATIDLLRLPDLAYYDFDPARQSALRHQLIMMNRYEGSTIGAPARVDLDAHASLPLIWATRLGNLRAWQVVTERNSTIVVSDLNSGAVTLHDAFYGPKKRDLRQVAQSAAGAVEGVVAPAGASASTTLLDLRMVANLPWQPGAYAITLLMHDWPSNTVTTTLWWHGEHLRGPVKPLRVGAQAARALRKNYQAMAASTAPPFDFAPSASTPRLHARGIALTLPAPDAQRRTLVHGAARLALLKGYMVDADAPDARASGRANGALPAAVVHLTMLVLQIDAPLPRTIEIQIPLMADAPLRVGDDVEVAFAVDIERALRTTLAPARYQIYVVGAEYVAGPYALTIAP